MTVAPVSRRSPCPQLLIERRLGGVRPEWKNGNTDSRPIAPRDTLTLAQLDGPGRMVHFSCTIADSEPFYSRLLTLRMNWYDRNSSN